MTAANDDTPSGPRPRSSSEVITTDLPLFGRFFEDTELAVDATVIASCDELAAGRCRRVLQKGVAARNRWL